ncbi:MAG: biotin transporter BioY [Clostridia bacterium]|nr:biotin transporter BioY [Clostridia bacterium]
MRDKARSHSSKNRIKLSVLISLFTAVIAVCSFVSVPSAVPFTLQTLGIFTTLTVLGGKHGTVCIALYIFIGLAGVPVFSGFGAGFGHITGATGGFILGFIICGFCYWIITKIFGNKTVTKAIGLITGLLLCYSFGTLWYAVFHLRTISPGEFLTVLKVCVLPFIIPDLLKLCVALIIDKKLPQTIR